MARESKAAWERRVARWVRSGLSRDEFAAREGVKPTTLAWWRWSLQSASSTTTALVKRDLTFVEVTPPPPAEHERIEVLLVNGRVVRVPQSFDADALKRVLDVADRR
jgi:hypothetical protein